MKVFGYEIKKHKEVQEFRSVYDEYNPMMGGMSFGSYGSYQSSKSLTLSACYRSVNLIGDAIASLQLKVYSVDPEGYKKEAYTNTLYQILGTEPNPNMSRSTFYKQIINSFLLRGNSYVKINRGPQFEVTSLQILNPDNVTIQTLGGELKYAVNGIKGLINNSDMIHILNFPVFGSPYGQSTISYAAQTLDTAYNSDVHAANWFKGGANASGFLSTTAGLTPKQEQDLINKFKAASNVSTGNPNGIVFMGGAGDIKLQTLGISPKESQLLETRAFNVVDIARFFNVNPILLFDNTKATYSNVENAQLDFLNTTLLPIIEKLENEFTRKLILPSQRNALELRFDVSNLLRADMATRADYYSKLFAMGVISPSGIAKELNLPKVEGTNGDKHFISTNLQELNNMIVDTTNSVDNKLL